MSDKDFLSQFSGDKKIPESFKEEERKPIEKQKKPVNVVLIIVLALVLIVAGLVAYLVFFAPNIEMPNFVGKTKTDVAAWVKQQDIEVSGIIFEEDYYFDYDEGVIISQNIDEGKKVRNDVKINFIASKGADPNELIKVPDLLNMNKQEIQTWISDNKLTKTKTTTAYSDSVEEGNVISFEYSGCDEDTFTRSSTLKISVSKGPQPAATITVEDFTKKTYETAEYWANQKKVQITKSEQYSDTIDKGFIISQSIASGKTMKEGETINVVVSKGKAIYMVDMYGWNETDITRWCNKNGVYASFEYDYSVVSKGVCVYQSVQANKVLVAGDYIDFIVSKGNPSISSTTYDALVDEVAKANIEGANLKLNVKEEFSDSPIGTILSISSNIKTGSTIDVVVSKGMNIYVEAAYDLDGDHVAETSWDDIKAYVNSSDKGVNEETIRSLCKATGITYKVSYETTDDVEKIGYISSITNKPNSSTYIGENVTVEIVIYSNN